MFSRIIIFIVILIILIYTYNYFEINKIENFLGLNKTTNNFNQTHSKIGGYNSQINNKLNNDNTQQMTQAAEKVLFNNRNYNQNLSVDNKNNKYYYNDMINQSDINETAFNIVYSIDPIDYSNIETGIDKCNRQCSGICFENGYDGIATCYPTQQQGFDWGTLYKNPTFTYGYNAYGPENLPQ